MHRYNSYSDFFRLTYGSRLQKLSIDAGFSCPNRDSNDRTHGGCTFCNNRSFNPSYCTPAKSITQQLDEGIEFHQRRYRKAGYYLAYFQAYSNTFAPLDILRSRYDEALAHPLVRGLIVATRPDCIDNEKLDLLAEKARDHYVAVEYGIESCYDATLRTVNRGHDFAATRRAITSTAQRGLHCGGHLILGLPGESRQMLLNEVDIINSLPLNSLKFHQLQILHGSAMADEIAASPDAAKRYHAFALEEYVSLVCDMLERLRPDIMMERFAGEVPPRFQALPERSWRRSDGRLIRNEEIPVLIDKELERRDTRQGILFDSGKQ